jgi:hypothetical protein
MTWHGGKGSRYRGVDKSKYGENFEAIFSKKQVKEKWLPASELVNYLGINECIDIEMTDGGIFKKAVAIMDQPDGSANLLLRWESSTYTTLPDKYRSSNVNGIIIDLKDVRRIKPREKDGS